MSYSSLFRRLRWKAQELWPCRGVSYGTLQPNGAPHVWLEIEPHFAEALLGVAVGYELIRYPHAGEPNGF